MRFIIATLLFFAVANAASIFDAEAEDEEFDLEQRVFREDKKPCCFPSKFEVFMGERIEHGTIRDEKTTLDFSKDINKRPHPHPRPHHMTRMGVMGRLSVDSDLKKAAMKLRIIQRPKPSEMIVVIDYSNKTMYIAYPEREHCQKLPAPQEMERMCLPPNSTYAGSFRWGAGDNAIEVDAWKAHVAQRKPMHVFMGVEVLVASGSCVPMAERGGGVTGRTRIGFEVSFVNLNTTISDPSVFTPPSYCDGVDFVDLTQADPTVLSFAQNIGKHF
eukprot:GHVO01067486.1.p2 GENE.GHVO01067486.1~~GHVO01067486.1.p2  ORF type:complete len:273 (-),score=45.62 GHVO01067486.1:163-981(-)